MSTLRLEPARVGTLAAREGQGRWYGFDLQLALYALSLTVMGLLMAFTNSASDPLQPGSLFMRGLIWLALAAVVFAVSATADHHWLRSFAWPIYLVAIGLLRRHARHRQRAPAACRAGCPSSGSSSSSPRSRRSCWRSCSRTTSRRARAR